MSSANSSHRIFAPVSIVILGLAAAILTAVGCTKADLFNASQSSVAPDSSEITLESYRDHKVVIVVPPGNHNPKLSWATLNSEKNMPPKTYEKFGGYSATELRAKLDENFQTALEDIASDPQTLSEIRKAGQLYGIDPALIVGDVIGEHVFNTKLVMLGQDKAMKAVMKSWANKWALHFSANGTSLSELLAEAPFNRCETSKRVQSDYWDCVTTVFEENYHGKPVGNPRFTKSLKYEFFNPIKSGLTYGLGQLDPIRALMVADRVNRISGLPYVTIENAVGIYEAILDPRSAVHFIAANIVVSLEIYRKSANFDISGNLGAVATLYNLGKEKKFAAERYDDNLKSLAKGKGFSIPVESYYGFYINEKENEIRRFIATGRVQ